MVLEKHPYKRYNHGNKFEVYRNQIIFYYLDRKNRIIKNFNNNSSEINGYNNTRLFNGNQIEKVFFGEIIEVNNFYKIEYLGPELHQRLGLVITTDLYFNFEEDGIFFIFDTEKNQIQQNQNQSKGIQQNQIQQNIDISNSINIYLSLYNPYIPYYIVIDKKKYYFRDLN